MTENQRESYRVDAGTDLDADLFHEGRVTRCVLMNLSAGGARVSSSQSIPVGGQCTLGVRLGAEHRPTATSLSYVSFLMEVLDATPGRQGRTDYRLRSISGPGSKQHEAAAHLVFEAERRRRARASGIDAATPMASDPERRSRLRIPFRQRFSKGSLRPDQD